MNEKTKMRIKLITNSGFKYSGEKLSENSLFVKLIDDKQGEISVPLANISYLKELNQERGVI